MDLLKVSYFVHIIGEGASCNICTVLLLLPVRKSIQLKVCNSAVPVHCRTSKKIPERSTWSDGKQQVAGANLVSPQEEKEAKEEE
eukprot:4202273-Karenia_brevis.AAC.1